MIKLGNPKYVQEYFEIDRVSQSYLKSLLRGVDHLGTDEEELHYKEKGSYVLGSAIDDLISFGKEHYEDTYHISDVAKPSDTIMSIIHKTFDVAKERLEEDPDTELTVKDLELRQLTGILEEAIEYHNYYPKWKMETKVNKLIEGGEAYFNDIRNAHGKQVLSLVEATIVDSIKMSWTSHKYTAEYFKDGPGIEIYFQVPIYFEYKDTECKCLIDMLIIDHNKKTIQPIDFKTTGKLTTEFGYAVNKFRYDFQGVFYTLGLVEFFYYDNGTTPIEELNECLSVINAGEQDYEVLPFKFMVETTLSHEHKITGDVSYSQGDPLMYVLSNETQTLGLHGRPEITYNIHSRASSQEELLRPVTPVRKKELMGVNQALDLYIWHLENGFEVDKHVFESNGIISV